MTARVRALDWASTSLGPAGAWPQALRVLVPVLLGSRQPMFLTWGAERVLIYNDAYAVLLGQRHPAALARPFFDVWPELRVEVGALMDRVFAGESIHMDDIELRVERNGVPETAHFAFSYTPVRDEHEITSGLFCACTETTGEVFAKRSLQIASARQAYFAQLGDLLRIEHDPQVLTDTAAALLERHLRLSSSRRAGRTEADAAPDRPRVIARGDAEGGVTFLAEPAAPARRAEERLLVEETTERVRAALERLRMEQQLRVSEARLRKFAEALPGFTWTADAAGRLDYTSRNWHLYAGADPQASNGEGWSGFVHPDDQALAFDRWAASVATLAPYEVEYRLRRADGAYRWWLARALPSEDESGTPLRWIGVCTDIDDIVAARETLTRSRVDLEHLVHERTRQLNRVWEHSRDLLIAIGSDGIFRAVSPSWTAILGHEPGEVVGRSFVDFLHTEDLAMTQGGLKDAVASRDLTDFENRYLHKDGSARWISWHTSVDDGMVYGYGRDVTAQKAQAEALRLASEQLRQSQKMEAVGQLTGGVAHDFNNLLQVISGNLQLLSRQLEGDAKAVRRVQSAQAAVARGAKLSSQLLAFSRRQALEPKVVSVGRLVAGMDDMLRRALGERVEIVMRVSENLWNAFVDPSQIENAVLNLAINGRDAMPDGGRLTIDVGNAKVDAAFARAHADLSPGEYVVVAVSDTGSGMTPEVMAQAFEPFFSTKPVGHGTGLGLSMVYGFANQSGGHVELRSEVGAGTTVRLYLPRARRGEDAVAPAPTGDTAGGTETVLVVEDDEAVRATVIEMLGDLGYRVLTAADAAAALGLVERGTAVDLLFTDVVMPGTLKSTELARRVRDRLPGAAVLFTSGYTEDAIVHSGRLDPGVELLSKPYSREGLARKVRQVLDQRG